MNHDHSQSELNHIATDYFLRRREAQWSANDEKQLRQWLKADAQHLAIYAHIARTWASLAKLPRPALASDPAELTQPAPPIPQHQAAHVPSTIQTRPTTTDATLPTAGARARSWTPGWGQLAPALLTVLVMATAGWYWWDNTPGYSQTIAHQALEPQTLALPDGSSIVVNADTDLQVHYYPRRREVALQRGEAFFQVAPDAKRPFTIDTGPSRVTVVGTVFNVRAAPPAMQVKVQQGEVHVQPDRQDPHASTVVLRAGQGISVTADGRDYAAIAVEADTVGDWRQGQLIFRQTPLPTVLEELQRYSQAPITLEKDPRLNSLRVTGSAITSHPEVFLQALPHLLPVRVQQQAGGWWIAAR